MGKTAGMIREVTLILIRSIEMIPVMGTNILLHLDCVKNFPNNFNLPDV
jgi:hypothetical protein